MRAFSRWRGRIKHGRRASSRGLVADAFGLGLEQSGHLRDCLGQTMRE